MNVALGFVLELLWPTVVLAAAYFLWDFAKAWLSRDATAVRELKAELAATHVDWEKRFSQYERAHDTLVTRVNNMQPTPNPLGKTYSTRSAG